MNIVLLSGGSGKRLWPLSNDIRSKQFIKVFRKQDGNYESMVQRVYHQIKTVDPDAKITIATSKTQVSAIRNQLGNDVSISVEPMRRDTFPAIALSTLYLTEVEKINPEEIVVVCPVDPYVENEYFEKLKELEKKAKSGEANLVLMGIEPTYPSEKYGYIIPKTQEEISEVKRFREKPSQKIAQEYIQQGALWNAGVFACKIQYILDKIHQYIDFEDYQDLYQKYHMLDKISFDYAVVEKETKIQVMRFSGDWKDLGTWNTLTEVMTEKQIGNVIVNEQCDNLHIINELEVPILAMGVQDAIICATPEGILVSNKEQSAYMKPFVDKMDHQVMFAEKSWGRFQVVNAEKESLTIKITLNSGHHMSYHRHQNRDEVWVILEGSGYAVVEGKKIPIFPGKTVEIKAGSLHTIFAESELQLIELQLGNDICVEDKIKTSLEDNGEKIFS